MVSHKQIRASNGLINDATAPLISVFVGGTSGIGKLTIKALVSTSTSIRIYIIGRKSAEEQTRCFIKDLYTTNPKAELIWLQAEVSLLSETKRVCEVIQSKESRIDLLFLTTGYAPFGTRKETVEGIEISQALTYYSRVLLIQLLLPLLNNAETPRVISVLSGGLEWSSINLADIDLKKPGNFTTVKAHIHNGAMTTTTLEKLSTDNPNVTFIHSTPGWVNTGNVRRGLDPASPNSFMAWVVWMVLEPLIRCLSFSDEEAGQRHLFLCTSSVFGGRGVEWMGKVGVNSKERRKNGLFLVGSGCDCVRNAKAVRSLRENVLVKVWEHTQGVLRPYL